MSIGFLTLATTSHLALLPEEDDDIRIEAGKFFVDPDAWLAQDNMQLGGVSPSNAILQGRENDVRNILRLLKYIGMS